MSKYHAMPTYVDNVRFASKAEARRYSELRLLERVGTIADLELQPRFPLVIDGHRLCVYVADFRYLDERGQTVVEDVKGMPGGTPLFRLKRKLMLAIYGINVVEVQA